MTRRDTGLNDDVPHMAADDDFNTVIILSQIRWPVNTEFASVPIDERKAHTPPKFLWKRCAPFIHQGPELLRQDELLDRRQRLDVVRQIGDDFRLLVLRAAADDDLAFWMRFESHIADTGSCVGNKESVRPFQQKRFTGEKAVPLCDEEYIRFFCVGGSQNECL